MMLRGYFLLALLGSSGLVSFIKLLGGMHYI